MSGSIGNIVNRATSVANAASTIVRAVSSATSAISAIFGGPGGGNIVSLGDVDLAGFEIPEKITVGGQQQMTVHKLTGGERVIDMMGRDDKSMDWSGYLQGHDAVARAQQLDQMRVDGDVQSLMWATYDFSVVIASFECDYQQGGFWLPYRISCTVLRDEAKEDAWADDEADAPSLDGGIAGAVSSVQGAISSVQGAIATATAVGQQVLGAVGQITGALGISLPFLSQASAGLAQAQGFSNALGQVSSGITQVQGLSTSLGDVSGFLSSGRDAVSQVFSGDMPDTASTMTASTMSEITTNAGAAAQMQAAITAVYQAQSGMPIDPVTPVPTSATASLTLSAPDAVYAGQHTPDYLSYQAARGRLAAAS